MLYQSFVTAGAPDPAVVESEDEPEQDSLQPNTQPDPIEVGCACFMFFNFDSAALLGFISQTMTSIGQSGSTAGCIGVLVAGCLGGGSRLPAGCIAGYVAVAVGWPGCMAVAVGWPCGLPAGYIAGCTEMHYWGDPTGRGLLSGCGSVGIGVALRLGLLSGRRRVLFGDFVGVIFLVSFVVS